MEAKQLRATQNETILLNDLEAVKQPETPSLLLSPKVQTVVTSAQRPDERRSPSPRPSVIEIRQPETSPKPSKRLSLPEINGNNEFSTPPGGVTTIPVPSPTEPARMMTRREALKVIAAHQTSTQDRLPVAVESVQPVQSRDSTSPSRKRFQDSLETPDQRPEKVT